MTPSGVIFAFVHAGVKVCARDTGVRAGGPRGEGTGLVSSKGMSVS